MSGKKKKKGEEHPVNVFLKYVCMGLLFGLFALVAVAGLKGYLKNLQATNTEQAQQVLDNLPSSLADYLSEDWDSTVYTNDVPNPEPKPEATATASPQNTPTIDQWLEAALVKWEEDQPSGRDATAAEKLAITAAFPAFYSELGDPNKAYLETGRYIASVWKASEERGRSSTRDGDLKSVIRDAILHSYGDFPTSLELEDALERYEKTYVCGKNGVKCGQGVRQTATPAPKRTATPAILKTPPPVCGSGAKCRQSLTMPTKTPTKTPPPVCGRSGIKCSKKPPKP